MAIRKKQEHGGELQFWQRGESGNPNGRPRKVLRQLEEKIGVEFKVSLSKEDIFHILQSMCELSVDEIKGIAQDKSSPVFMVNIANAIKEDIDKGRTTTLDNLFDRFFGKAKPIQDPSGETPLPTKVQIEIVGGTIRPVTSEDDIAEV